MPLRRSLAAVTLLVLVVCPRLSAQTTYATLTGTVTDSSGGVIKGAVVVATNVDTSVTTKTTTNSEGVYTVPQLREGPYTLSITAPGLREFLAVDIVLVTRDVRRIDAVLQWAASAALQVTPGNAPIELETQRISDVRTAEQLRTLPLNDPGRLVVSGDHALAVDARRGYSFAGSRSNQSVFAIDGTSMTDGVGRERHRAARQLHRVVQGSEDRHGEQQRRVAEPRPGHHRLEVGNESLRGRGLRLLPEPDVPGQEPVLGPACPPASAFPRPRGRRPDGDSQVVQRPRPDVLVRLRGNGRTAARRRRI